MEKFNKNDLVKGKNTNDTGRVVAVYGNGIVCVDWYDYDSLVSDPLAREDVFADQLVNVTAAAEKYLTKEAAFNAGMDAARDMSAAQKLTKPVSIGGVRFHVGVDVSHVLRAAERRYEYEQSPEYKAQQAERMAQFMESAAKPVIAGTLVHEKWERVCQEMARAEIVGGAAFDEFDLAMQGLSKPANGGCGACGDACTSRGSCRLDGESPQPAGEAVAYITDDGKHLVFADKVQKPTTMRPLIYGDITITAPAAPDGEAVAWEYFDGVWRRGVDSDRANYEAFGYPTRDLYTRPVPDARLVEALRLVEFGRATENHRGDIVYTCPDCASTQEQGHDSDCTVAAALSATGKGGAA